MKLAISEIEQDSHTCRTRCLKFTEAVEQTIALRKSKFQKKSVVIPAIYCVGLLLLKAAKELAIFPDIS